MDPRNKPCDVYLVEYEGISEKELTLDLGIILQDPDVSDSQVLQMFSRKRTWPMVTDRVATKEESV